MRRAAQTRLPRRLPNAAWAWEFLRRNPLYREAFLAARDLPVPEQLKSGGTLYQLRRAFPEAENWGLLMFADPEQSAIDADVFWHTDLLAGALRVKLTQVDELPDDPHDTIILSALKTRRVIMQTANGARHILLNGDRFWIHIYSIKKAPPHEFAEIDVRVDGAKHMQRRLDTAAQLLALHKSTGEKLSLIGRRKNAGRLVNALVAYDVWKGFEQPQGGLREIAVALFGEARVREDWTGSSRYLKDFSRRARDKGIGLVEGGYKTLLSRKSL